jgi:hypothetical protein
MIMNLVDITAAQGSVAETEKKRFYKMPGMPNGRTTVTGLIIPGRQGMQYGVCMIITGDVAIIFAGAE